MHRRQLLHTLAAAPLLLAAPRLWAAERLTAQTPRFLFVFLRGGYDAANLLVPIAPGSRDFYAESRPHIAVPQPGSGKDAALPLDADWALNPVLGESLVPLWQAGQIGFVPFAGTADLTRSHFETQDHIELGQGPVTRDYRSGFLNRLAAVLGQRAAPMAFAAHVPLSLQGAVAVPNAALRGARPAAPMPAPVAADIAAMYAGSELQHSVEQGFATQRAVQRDLQQEQQEENTANRMAGGYAAEMIAASRGAPGAGAFAQQAARIGRLMREQYNLGFVDLGGWDTHVGEAGRNGADGLLANRLRELGQGLAALPAALGPAWRATTVVVVSEFGRTFRENGGRGTDHGHGTVYWVLGGGIRGGRIAGEQVALSPSTLNQNRDYPVLSNDRDLLGGLLQRQWGLSAQQVQTVFPGSRPLDLRWL